MEISHLSYSYNNSLCEYMIDEYINMLLARKEKNDFYDDKMLFKKNISLTQSDSSNFKKKYYIINLEIKYLPGKKKKKINNKKNSKKSLRKRIIIKIDKNFLKSIISISRRKDILKDIRKRKYIEYKLLCLIKAFLVYKALIK